MGIYVFTKNLETITPESMMFKITSKNKDEKMYPGMIITYIVSPLLKIKLTWMTEITQVKEKSFFIDEQRLGHIQCGIINTYLNKPKKEF